MMIVMIRMKNHRFFYKWCTFRSIIFKISGQSPANFHKLLLCPDVCISTYCDEKRKHLKQLLADSIVNENQEKEEKISEKASSSNQKIDLLKQLRAYEFLEEEADNSKIEFLKTEDEGQRFNELLDVCIMIKAKQHQKQNPVVTKIITNLLNKLDVEERDNKYSEKEKLLSDANVLQKALNDAMQFAIANKEIVSLHHVLYFVELLYKNSQNWTTFEKAEFISSKEFRNLHSIFLKFIPIISTDSLVFQFLPLFSRYLNLPLDDIIFYEIFKKIDNESINLNYKTKIKVLKECDYLEVSEMISDLKEKLLSEINNLHFGDSLRFMFAKDLLYFSTFKSISEDVKIKALEKFLAFFKKERNIDDFSKYFQTFYMLSDESRKKYAHLEKEGINCVETILLKDRQYFNALCGIIYLYGNAVSLKKTEVNRKFVDNVLNAIVEFKRENSSANAINSLISGVRKTRHINYKFLNYVAENFINNFETFEKHGLLMFRLLRTFADHDCPSNCKEWPFVKIILENVNLHAIMLHGSGRNSIATVLGHLIENAHPLICMEVFPEELLNKIFELSSNERIIAKLPLHKLQSFLDLHQVLYYLNNERGRLLSKETVKFIVEQRDEYLKDDPLYLAGIERNEKFQKCLEEAFGIKDSVLKYCTLREEVGADLIMAFNNENKPYCLQSSALEKGEHIEDFDFPVESKKVVVRYRAARHFLEDSNGNYSLQFYERTKNKIFQKLGFIVVVIKNENVECLTDDKIGFYIYNEINKAIASSSV